MPTGRFAYIIVVPQPPVLPNAQIGALARTPYAIIESELVLRGVRAEGIRTHDGTRIYRVPVRELWKLQADRGGAFVPDGPHTRYRLVTTDPSVGRVLVSSWVPL